MICRKMSTSENVVSSEGKCVGVALASTLGSIVDGAKEGCGGGPGEGASIVSPAVANVVGLSVEPRVGMAEVVTAGAVVVGRSVTLGGDRVGLSLGPAVTGAIVVSGALDGLAIEELMVGPTLGAAVDEAGVAAKGAGVESGGAAAVGASVVVAAVGASVDSTGAGVSGLSVALGGMTIGLVVVGPTVTCAIGLSVALGAVGGLRVGLMVGLVVPAAVVGLLVAFGVFASLPVGDGDGTDTGAATGASVGICFSQPQAARKSSRSKRSH